MSSRMRQITALAIVTAVGTAVGLGSAATVSGVSESQTVFTASTGVPGGGGNGDDDEPGGGSSDGCMWSTHSSDVTRDQAVLLFPGLLNEFDEAVGQDPEGTATLLWTTCEGRVRWRWVTAETVTVDDLWPAAYDEAVGRITPPVVAIAPPVAQGTMVNVPNWLAVEPAGPFSARAQVGSVWAQVDASFAGVMWDMGDGSVVDCETFGTIWAGEVGTGAGDWAESPDCGYTYEVASFPEYTPDGADAYHVTVTTHWDLQLTGSDGRNEALDPIDSSFELDYQVHELQTVGHAD